MMLIHIALILGYFSVGHSYTKYGRSCKDIGCPSNQECVMQTDPCNYYQRQGECGTFPTCERVSNSARTCATYVCPPTKVCRMDGETPKCVDDASKVGHVGYDTQNQNSVAGNTNNQQGGSIYPQIPKRGETTPRPINYRPANSGSGGYQGGQIGSSYPGRQQPSYTQPGYPGYPQNNYPQQAYPQQNYPQQNYPQQNYPQQAYPQQQGNYPRQVNPQQGAYPQGNTNLQQTARLYPQLPTSESPKRGQTTPRPNIVRAVSTGTTTAHQTGHNRGETTPRPNIAQRAGSASSSRGQTTPRPNIVRADNTAGPKRGETTPRPIIAQSSNARTNSGYQGSQIGSGYPRQQSSNPQTGYPANPQYGSNYPQNSYYPQQTYPQQQQGAYPQQAYPQQSNYPRQSYPQNQGYPQQVYQPQSGYPQGYGQQPAYGQQNYGQQSSKPNQGTSVSDKITNSLKNIGTDFLKQTLANALSGRTQ